MQQTIHEDDPTHVVSGSSPTIILTQQDQTQLIDPFPVTKHAYTCPVCHHQVSHDARWCPQCAHPNPIMTAAMKEMDEWLMGWPFRIAFLLMAIMFLALWMALTGRI